MTKDLQGVALSQGRGKLERVRKFEKRDSSGTPPTAER